MDHDGSNQGSEFVIMFRFINIDFDKNLSAYFNLGMLLLAVLVSLQLHVCICIADVTENFLVLN